MRCVVREALVPRGLCDEGCSGSVGCMVRGVVMLRGAW